MIGFLLIGGAHQLLHIVPVAAALSREAGPPVGLFAASASLASSACEQMGRLGAGAFEAYALDLPRVVAALAVDTRTGSNLKALRLLRHARRLRRCQALVTAERTSTLLQRLPGHCPPMIHLRHGAGDRAVGFESRIAMFDQVIVAGEKDRQRVIASRLLPPERVHACGYIKLAALRQLGASRRPLFDNDRPTVLYNPHFRRELSSWHVHGAEVIRRIRECGRFNLVVAPHIRLFADASAAARQAWERLAAPGEVIVDLGSQRSLDMTYTLAADIYVGDVSSQVYEFTSQPRPCVFLDSHGAAWQDNPDYLMWKMGEVIASPQLLLAALARAGELHHQHRPLQQQMTQNALGDTGPECATNAARVILRSLN
jgi:hypothetical protein